MKTITTESEIASTFAKFAPNGDGAFATCRLIEGAESAMDPQEWAERGTVDGAPAMVYYIFAEEEASSEDASEYPWDEEHISKIEIAEQDEDGDYETL